MCQVLLNLLYYYGTRGLVKESLLQRYFSMVLLVPPSALFPYFSSIYVIMQIHSGLLSDALCRKYVAMGKILNQRLSKPAEVLVTISFFCYSVVKIR